MKTASVSTLRSNLSEYLNQTEAVMVTQSGQPKALLLPVAAGDDLERLFMANNPEFEQVAGGSRPAHLQHGGHSP